MDNKDYLTVLLYSSYTTITGWGVLLKYGTAWWCGCGFGCATFEGLEFRFTVWGLGLRCYISKEFHVYEGPHNNVCNMLRYIGAPLFKETTFYGCITHSMESLS